MKQKTFQELEQELVDSKKREEKLRECNSTLRKEVLETRHYMKGLIGQYERVIKDWKKIAYEYQQHIWKMFFISVYKKIRREGGEK